MTPLPKTTGSLQMNYAISAISGMIGGLVVISLGQTDFAYAAGFYLMLLLYFSPHLLP